jgi:zinc protease
MMRGVLGSIVLAWFSISTLMAPPVLGVGLVTPETINAQKRLTSHFKLKNGIPVTYRMIPDSDILDFSVTFGFGLKDLTAGQKSLNRWLWAVMKLESGQYPKEKVFEISEKYALSLKCSGGIEMSRCSLETLNDYWKYGLPLFADLLKNPTLSKANAQLIKDRLIADLKSTPTDPASYINEVINKVYYPKGHAYRLNHDEALKELEKLTEKDLKNLHKRVLNASIMELVVVGSLPQKQLMADLNREFAAIKPFKAVRANVKEPEFDSKNAYAFEDRDIPTAYIRGKMVVPDVKHKDAVATRLMFEILSEELGEEIRTKRSLSYAVYSFVIQYSLGIGVLSASTSKPKETIEAMSEVIKTLKTRKFSKSELDEYKRIFATDYFLTLETHDSLAGAITSALFYHGTVDRLYKFPGLIEAVTPEDINRTANKYLTDIRVGVIYNRKKFEDKWVMDFVKSSRKKEDDKS